MVLDELSHEVVAPQEQSGNLAKEAKGFFAEAQESNITGVLTSAGAGVVARALLAQVAPPLAVAAGAGLVAFGAYYLWRKLAQKK